MASGSWRWHAPSACSPSSASVISKCMPSRMRRATFLMTLESSTTKQLFMTHYSFELLLAPTVASCGNRTVPNVQNTINVEYHHELAFEPIDSRGDPRQPRVEVGRLCLAGAVGKLHHLADRIDEKPVGLALEFDADRHHRRTRLALAEIEPRAHVDRGHDAAAQIEDTGDLRRRQRHPRQANRHEHILHAEDWQAEHMIADRHRDVFGDEVGGAVVGDGHGLSQAAWMMSAVCSLSAAMRLWRSNLAT